MSTRTQTRIAPLPDKAGYCAWFEGTIRITDPTYLRPDFPGTVPLDDLTVTFEDDHFWEVTTTMMDRAPDPRTGSLVMRRVAANPKPEDTETIEIGKVSVDTGYIAIVAERFGGIPNWKAFDDALSDVNLDGGEIFHMDGCLAVRSGIGDGKYSVHGTRHADTGELVQVTVDFTPSQAAWELIYGGAR